MKPLVESVATITTNRPMPISSLLRMGHLANKATSVSHALFEAVAAGRKPVATLDRRRLQVCGAGSVAKSSRAANAIARIDASERVLYLLPDLSAAQATNGFRNTSVPPDFHSGWKPFELRTSKKQSTKRGGIAR